MIEKNDVWVVLICSVVSCFILSTTYFSANRHREIKQENYKACLQAQESTTVDLRCGEQK